MCQLRSATGISASFLARLARLCVRPISVTVGSTVSLLDEVDRFWYGEPPFAFGSLASSMPILASALDPHLASAIRECG
jgi:hypothetical protein